MMRSIIFGLLIADLPLLPVTPTEKAYYVAEGVLLEAHDSRDLHDYCTFLALEYVHRPLQTSA